MAKAKKAAKKAAAKPPAKQKPATSAPAAAGSTAVLDEILKVTGEAKPKKGEALKDFVFRVCTAMADETKVTDDQFKAMSAAASGWYNEAEAAYNAEKFSEIPSLPGMPEYKVEAVAAAPAAAAATATPPPPAAPAGKPAKAPKASKVAKAPAAPKERKVNTGSATYKIRQAVVRKPDITFEAAAKLAGLSAKEQSSASHAFNTFQHARAVVALYREHTEKK